MATNFLNKARRNGLPQALLFSSKDKTMSLAKFLSIEFRRKLLLGEVKPSKLNKDVMDKFNVTDLPALIVIPLSSSSSSSSSEKKSTKNEDEGELEEVQYIHPVRYERKKEDFTRHKLHSFLSKHALKKIVVKTTNNEGSNNTTTTNDTLENETKSKKKDAKIRIRVPK